MLRATVPIAGLVVGAETSTERPVDDHLGCLDNILIGLGVGVAFTLGVDYFAGPAGSGGRPEGADGAASPARPLPLPPARPASGPRSR